MTSEENSRAKKLIPTDLMQDYAEIGADDLVEHAKSFFPVLGNLGDEIPYVKTALAAIRFPRTLSDVLLGRKVYAFLFASGIDDVKMRKFHEKFTRVKRERLWEQVVLSINSHDDKRRSEIIGKLFSSLIDEYLSEDEFFSMVHATNTLNLGTLESLKQIYMLNEVTNLKAAVYYSLATVVLVDIYNDSIGAIGAGGPKYPLNQLGWKYTGVVFDFPASSIASVRIGDGVLVDELGEDGQQTNKAYPLSYLQSTGKPYKEVDVFLLNSSNQILCEEDTCFPIVLFETAIPSGSEPLETAQSLIDEDMTNLRLILSRRSEDTKIQKNAFTVVGDLNLSHTVWKDFRLAREELLSIGNYDDHKRYLIAATEQMERYITGDLVDRAN